MASVLYGLLGFLLAAALMSGGFVLGWKLHARQTKPPTPEELGAQDRQRLINEQNAFRDMMNYNADVAYGLVSLYEKEGE